MNQQRGPKLIDSLNKPVTTALLVAFAEQTPVWTRFIEREVNKLSGKLGFFNFDLGVGGGESKRAACGITWILIATHCFYLRSGLQMINLGRISDAKLFCPVSGPNATTGQVFRKKFGDFPVKRDEGKQT
jgi:hypothetical protein